MSVFQMAVDDSTGVTVLTLDTAQAGNAIAYEQLDEATAYLSDLAAKAPRALVIRGTSDFCAGRIPPAPGTPVEPADVQVGRTVNFFSTFASIPCPKVSFVTGQAYGAGANLALQADILVADQSAEFAFPEIRAGFAPLLALNTLLRTVRTRDALWLVTTAESVGADRGLAMGLVSETGTFETALARAAWLAGHRAEWSVATAFAWETAALTPAQRAPLSLAGMIEESERSRKE